MINHPNQYFRIPTFTLAIRINFSKLISRIYCILNTLYNLSVAHSTSRIRYFSTNNKIRRKNLISRSRAVRVVIEVRLPKVVSFASLSFSLSLQRKEEKRPVISPGRNEAWRPGKKRGLVVLCLARTVLYIRL